ncbi:BACON domain-containing protein [Bacteroides sp. GD17]|uniref:BACON domain-containing protein n=1 Tax=Bacteroides sp. GD17 TaxID=3139826 RepID=UPI0025E3F977|nr:BACON domain-containing protein [uncultured Bacteroides sp.]
MKRKKYQEAIKAFKAAMQCDSKLTEACMSKIKTCENILHPTPAPEPVISRLAVTPKSVQFGCETKSGETIKVESTPQEWTATSDADWCTVVPKEKTLSINCQTNWLTTERRATITISNEKMKEKVIVIQGGQKEFINIALETLEFSAKGEIKELQVDTNAEWEVADIPEWCEAIAKDRGKLILKVEKTKKARTGTLIVKSKGGEISSIIISQKKGGLF